MVSTEIYIKFFTIKNTLPISYFNRLDRRFFDMPHITTKFSRFERSITAIWSRQWQIRIIIWDVGIWTRLSCSNDASWYPVML